MIEVIGFITVMLALPFVLALILRGGAWYRERHAFPDVEELDAFLDAPAESSTGSLFDCARPAEADPSRAAQHPWGSRHRRSDYGARRAFGRDAFPSLMPKGDGVHSPNAPRGGGFAQVHLRLTDNRGRAVTVERKLCLN